MIDLDKFRILSMVCLDDRASDIVLEEHVDGYVRGMVLQDRETGEVSAVYRFKYPDGKKNWYKIDKKPETGISFEDGMKQCFLAGLQFYDGGEDIGVAIFKIPDDGGDVAKTLDWLVENDLGEITEIGGVKTKEA